jgi:phospholipid transport system substrate-binding protein
MPIELVTLSRVGPPQPQPIVPLSKLWERAEQRPLGRNVHPLCRQDRDIEPLTKAKVNVSGGAAGKSSEHVTRFTSAHWTAIISNPPEVSKVSVVLRRFLLTTVVVLITIPAAADTDPAAFIDNLGKQLQAVSSFTSPQQKLAGFRELFRDDFDVPGLGRFVLGRFWRIFTPSEQQEFLGLFENFVVLTYSKTLQEYADGGGSPRVISSRPDPDGAIVSSEIIRGSGPWAGHGPTLHPIRVDWRLSARDGMYKISDVIIDGFSKAANGRSQLEGVVERNGGRVQAILAVMRQQIASASAR